MKRDLLSGALMLMLGLVTSFFLARENEYAQKRLEAENEMIIARQMSLSNAPFLRLEGTIVHNDGTSIVLETLSRWLPSADPIRIEILLDEKTRALVRKGSLVGNTVNEVLERQAVPAEIEAGSYAMVTLRSHDGGLRAESILVGELSAEEASGD